MMWVDLLTYLPDDILVKVDRMSMANSLEVRSPFLDHRVVEFMAGVPKAQKFGLTGSKVLLRRLASRYLPDHVLARPKQGFAVPLASWLQNELRPWMNDLLLSPKARERGYFRDGAVRGMIDQHVAGRRDYSQQLWALLVLESWFQSRPCDGKRQAQSLLHRLQLSALRARQFDYQRVRSSLSERLLRRARHPARSGKTAC